MIRLQQIRKGCSLHSLVFVEHILLNCPIIFCVRKETRVIDKSNDLTKKPTYKRNKLLQITRQRIFTAFFLESGTQVRSLWRVHPFTFTTVSTEETQVLLHNRRYMQTVSQV